MSERPSFGSSSRSSKSSKSSSSLRHDSRNRCRGCEGVPFVVIILILVVVVLSHAVESILFGHLHDQLITRLDHSFQGGLLLLQLLNVFPQPLAQGLQLYDLLA
jgi:hypothetical protein